ncbi:uncharacterized protein LOC141614556 [Silene latifolia]|uniref:uncharacterized protein LOC141614556 n=1 Tax=Silene latifolia TaxID=37657 RepID=UPI003D77D74F
MATDSANSIPESKNTASFSIVPVENPGARITQTLLNGKNYDEWCRTLRLALLAKGKLDYVDGTISKPDPSDSDYKSWRSANALVCMWIYNSIEPDLRTSISLPEEATQLLLHIKHRFILVNDAQIFQLESDIIACKQGPTETIMSYFGRIKKLWDDLLESDALPTCDCNPCSCNLKAHLDIRRDKKRVRSFLMGLDARYGVLRSHILGTDPLPSLNQIYSRLQHEEGMRNTLQNSNPIPQPEPMIYAVTTTPYGYQNSGGTSVNRGQTNAGGFLDPCSEPGSCKTDLPYVQETRALIQKLLSGHRKFS